VEASNKLEFFPYFATEFEDSVAFPFFPHTIQECLIYMAISR